MGKCSSKSKIAEDNTSNDCNIRLSYDTTFNVSKFLTRYKTNKELIKKMDKFALELDKKVHISAGDPRYRTIYQDIDTIVNRLCKRLRETHPDCKGAYIQRTGSTYKNPT